MLVQARIKALRKLDGIDWITALRSTAIRKLDRSDSDEVGLFKILQHPDYPGERLVACRNPRLAAQRAHTRESLLQATERLLAPIRASVAAGRLEGEAETVWPGLSMEQLLGELRQIQQFELLFPGPHGKGQPRVETVVSKQTLVQQSLAQALDLNQSLKGISV